MQLEELMLKHGYSIKGLAREAGVSPGTIHRLIHRDPKTLETRPETMRKIATLLKVAIEDVDEFDEIIKTRLGKDRPAPAIREAGQFNTEAGADTLAPALK